MMLRLRCASTNERRNQYSRSIFGAVVAMGLVAAGQAAAQAPSPPPVIEGEVAPPIEILLETVNGEVRCSPPTVRLPGREPLDIHVRNASEQPIVFAAPDFLQSSDIVRTTDRAFLEAGEGQFLVAPEGMVRIVMEAAPPPGEYGYACNEPGEQPTPESSGFLVVLPVEE